MFTRRGFLTALSGALLASAPTLGAADAAEPGSQEKRTLDDQELGQTWVTRAVKALVSELERAKPNALSDGGLYHAVHALRRYKGAHRKMSL